MGKIDNINQIIENIYDIQDEFVTLIGKLIEEVSEYVEHS